MDFLQHTINWCKGEIFEGKMSLLFGIILLVLSISYWIFGSTPYARSMPVPLMVVALFSISLGIYLISTNKARIPIFTEEYQSTQEKFVEAEKERTEAFIKWYPYTRYIFFGVMIVGALAMILSNGAWIRAIGIGLILLSLYVFVLDHFSEERAVTYHKYIIEALN